jgi:hypothetical protein
MRVRSFLFMIFFSIFASGCASTSITGKKSSTFNGEVDSALVVIVDFWISKSDPSISSSASRNDPAVSGEIDSFMKYFAGRCSDRWPQIFSANDKQFKVARKSIIQPASFSYESNFILLIQPYSVIYRHGMNNIKFKAALTERVSARPVWEGTIDYTPTYSGDNGIDGSVDELAKSLLTQLKNDGVITLSSPEIKLPK